MSEADHSQTHIFRRRHFALLERLDKRPDFGVGRACELRLQICGGRECLEISRRLDRARRRDARKRRATHSSLGQSCPCRSRSGRPGPGRDADPCRSCQRPSQPCRRPRCPTRRRLRAPTMRPGLRARRRQRASAAGFLRGLACSVPAEAGAKAAVHLRSGPRAGS